MRIIDKKFIIFLLLSTLILIFTAGSYGVVETSDARYAEIAREMLISHDWLHPLLLDIHHYHKPPITYQITAIGYEIFGINPFGARFFLQISVVIQLILVYLIAKRLKLGEKTALYASVIYLSFPLVLASSRTLTTDSFLTTFALASIYFWIRYRLDRSVVSLYLMSIMLGLGFLTKGPVVLIVPLLFAIFWRVKVDNSISSIHKVLAFSIFVAISASWFIYLGMENSLFWDYFIKKQTVERFDSNVFHRHEPFWYYWVLIPIIGMPWLTILPWILTKTKDSITKDTLIRSLLLIALITIIFFSLSSSKRVFYILPLFGFFAIIIAKLLEYLPDRDSKILERVISIYAILLISILSISPWIDIKNISIPKVVDIYALSSILLVALIYKWSLSSKHRAILISLVASIFLLISATATLTLSPLSFKISKPVADWIKSNHLESREILVYNNRLPSLAFALNKPIISLYDGNRYLNREVQFEDDKKWKSSLYNLKSQYDVDRLKRVMRRNPSILVLYKKDIPANRSWLKSYFKDKKVIGRWILYY